MHEEQQMEQFPENSNQSETAAKAEVVMYAPLDSYLAIFIVISLVVLDVFSIFIVNALFKYFQPDISMKFGEKMVGTALGTVLTSLVILYMMERDKVSFSKLFGNWYSLMTHWKHILMLFPIVLFNISLVGVSIGLLAKVAPDFVYSLFKDYEKNADSYSPIIDTFIFTGLGGIIIPICEEFMFRATILHRFASYKTPHNAVLASAILFACLHPQNIIGTFVFAYCAAVIYIHTKSLIFPIGIHIANNSLASYLQNALPLQSPAWSSDLPNIVDLQQIPLSDFVLLTFVAVISGGVIWYYLKRHLITADTKLPYFTALAESQPSSQSSIATT